MDDNNIYSEGICQHYTRIWKKNPSFFIWDKGPLEMMSADFRVLEFSPTNQRQMWTYATCGLSTISDEQPFELHIFSGKKDEKLIELLSAVAFYNKHTNRLWLNHTIYFGKGWQNDSKCAYGLISLPYLDGPELENLIIDKKPIKFFWLLPITKEEVDFKIKEGIEALEVVFDEKGLDYLNANRLSLI